MKTAMITGINGQDGYYLSSLLLEKGYNVVGLSRRPPPEPAPALPACEAERLRIEYYSLHDASCLYRLLERYRPDEFYNLAGQSHVGASFKIPIETVDTISLATIAILEAIRYTDKSIRLYQASSSEIFGSNPNIPFTEDTTFFPSSPYACAKVLSHNLIRNYRASYDMHVSAGILFNHESPRRNSSFVTRKITSSAAKIKMGLQDKLYLGNLDACRDWGFAGDYVKAMWLMLQQDKPDDYVIATGKVYSVRDWLSTVFDIAGLRVEDHVEINESLFRPTEVNITCGDATKAKQVLGWEPKVEFRDLARLMYEHDLTTLSSA